MTIEDQLRQAMADEAAAVQADRPTDGVRLEAEAAAARRSRPAAGPGGAQVA